MIQATLIFLIDKEKQKVLLAMKKRGFGEGKWNGTGGKINSGETVRAAAVREAFEELKIKIAEQDLELAADCEFYFSGHPDWDTHGTVFICETWQGEPAETEEMRPQWFGYQDIPYAEMWEDDRYWLGRVLAGEKLRCQFYFDGEGKSIDMNIKKL